MADVIASMAFPWSSALPVRAAASAQASVLVSCVESWSATSAWPRSPSATASIASQAEPLIERLFSSSGAIQSLSREEWVAGDEGGGGGRSATSTGAASRAIESVRRK